MSIRQSKKAPKKRFAIGAEVRVKLPGVSGIVMQLDASPTVLGEYWHIVRTQLGDRKEPGSNLELIPAPVTNAKPAELSTLASPQGLLPPNEAISLLRAQLEEPIEDLRHDDTEVDSWERVTLSIIERAFGVRSRNANHFVVTLSYARQSDEEKQAWHVNHIREKKGLLRAFIKELEILSPHRPQTEEDRFARMAVEEARKSAFEDKRPHPLVGCVVVKNGQVIAKSHRGEIDGNHAEFIALEKKLGDNALTGCTVYTTLEPCTTRNHPKIPCADRLIERKVARVVIGTLDPNPEIRGKGLWKLQQANIAVDMFSHPLVMELNELNRHFFRFIAESGTASNQTLREKERLSVEPMDGSARFRSPGQPLGVFWSSIPAYIKKSPVSEIQLASGPAMWLRLSPAAQSHADLSLPMLIQHIMSNGKLWLEPLNWGNIGYIRAEDGFGVYARYSETDTETNSVAFVFDTGEVWAIDTGILSIASQTVYFGDVQEAMCSRLPHYKQFLHNLGIGPPFRWVAGLVGIKGRRLDVQHPGEGISRLGEVFLKDRIVCTGPYDGTQEPQIALGPFFQEVFRKSSMAYPNYLRG
jgi:pyrimidine deaminase RibD-like protein